jgi:hypothetical protein
MSSSEDDVTRFKLLLRESPSIDSLSSKSVTPETTSPALDSEIAKDSNGMMRIKTNSEGISSTLTIDLRSYVDSFDIGDKETASRIRRDLSNLVSGFNGSLFLDEMFQKAISGKDLSDKDIADIRVSPAYLFMVDSLVEIIKNTMDEALLGHYENGLEAKLNLTINFDISSPENIILTLTDNGRGFSDPFLRQVSTPIKMTEYLDQVGSQKKNRKDDIFMPPLFGGAGKGLRILMALILEGKNFMRARLRVAKYQKPEVSTIHLGHAPMGGALIQINTSRAPLQKITAAYKAGVGAPAGAGSPVEAGAGSPARGGSPAEAGLPEKVASAHVLKIINKKRPALTLMPTAKENGPLGGESDATTAGREAMQGIRKKARSNEDGDELTSSENKGPSR